MKKVALMTLCLLAVAGPAAARTKIFVSMGRLDPFLTILRDSVANEAAKDPDLDVTIENAQNDEATQLDQIREAIANKTDAVIVLTVDSDPSKKIAKMASDAKMPLIFLNRLPPIDHLAAQSAVVTSNDLVAGRLQMRLIAEKIGNKGNVVILRGLDTHPATRDRTQGVKEILATRPDINVVENESGHWNRAEAEQMVTTWLNTGVHIDAIVANNDEMALGAIAALQEKHIAPGKVAVAGVDGTKDALAAMKSGYLTLSLLQNAQAQGAEALTDAKKLANGEYAQAYDWVPYEIIVPSNMNQFVKP